MGVTESFAEKLEFLFFKNAPFPQSVRDGRIKRQNTYQFLRAKEMLALWFWSTWTFCFIRNRIPDPPPLPRGSTSTSDRVRPPYCFESRCSPSLYNFCNHKWTFNMSQVFHVYVWCICLFTHLYTYILMHDRYLSLFSQVHKAVDSKVKVKVTLRLAVYRQSVRLGVKPRETHDQRFFQLIPCSNSRYVTSSLTRRWVCLLWLAWPFIKRTACYWKFFLLHCIQVLCQYRLCEV
jgi:hypothetical protein